MRRLLGFLVCCLLFAACGKTSLVEPTAAGTSTFPLTVTVENGSITIPKKPVRIVSLSPTATEMLFAIGAGPQVVAVDDQSNYPPGVPRTKLSGFEPNVEAIAAYKPDLVVFADDSHKLGDSLKALAIPAILQSPAKQLNDAYAQTDALGRVTDHRANAASVVDQMRRDIASLVAHAPKLSPAPTYYHELSNEYYSATSSTFIGKVYALLGLKNIADAADKAGTGYPQLSPEYIIESNPSLIFLADTKCCSQTAETVAKRPGWDKIDAVTSGHVIALDDDVVSRWGPRIVDFLRTVERAVKALKQAA
ncbi:MAG: ABC transporter substrate-binding protein [Actinobacteria bacterium]|nr:MAG: ABC transporter substrate-binding protein [Actinomycetota bacterium]